MSTLTIPSLKKIKLKGEGTKNFKRAWWKENFLRPSRRFQFVSARRRRRRAIKIQRRGFLENRFGF